MKRWIINTLIAFLLVSSIMQHIKIKKYEDALVNTYELNVNWASTFGMHDAIRHIDHAIDAINEESELIKSLGTILTSFRVAEASYAFMEPYVGLETKHMTASFNNYMGWFYRDMTNYIYELLIDIQNGEIDSQIVTMELSQLREATEYININMNQELLREKSIHEINLTWQETIEKILLDYPDHPLFKAHRESYYRGLLELN